MYADHCIILRESGNQGIREQGTGNQNYILEGFTGPQNGPQLINQIFLFYTSNWRGGFSNPQYRVIEKKAFSMNGIVFVS